MNDIDRYISQFPAIVQQLLTQVRNTIRKACTEATEDISYAMPAYKLNGKALVYFAGYKNHIGFYATPTGHKEFEKDLSKYKQGKGSVQFPIDEPMPLDLIKRIVEFRAYEVAAKTTKSNEKTCRNGHKYIKSSDCPTCPICENLGKPKDSFLSELSAPARRALENAGITTVKKLSGFTEKEILVLHGMGKSSLPKLIKILNDQGLKFKSK